MSTFDPADVWPRLVAVNLKRLMYRYNAVYAAPPRPARFRSWYVYRQHEHYFNIGPRR